MSHAEGKVRIAGIRSKIAPNGRGRVLRGPDSRMGD